MWGPPCNTSSSTGVPAAKIFSLFFSREVRALPTNNTLCLSAPYVWLPSRECPCSSTFCLPYVLLSSAPAVICHLNSTVATVFCGPRRHYTEFNLADPLKAFNSFSCSISSLSSSFIPSFSSYPSSPLPVSPFPSLLSWPPPAATVRSEDFWLYDFIATW